MKREESSDPLPYTQVDRAVKPKAALLAGALGVSTQHVLGSLVEFWELNGDPRDLEALLVRGVREVVLTESEVAGRFALASGKLVEPKQLAQLGFLEERENGTYRIRGMSRFFAPIERRLQRRAAAKAGGRARAAQAERAGGKFVSNASWQPAEYADEHDSGGEQPKASLATSDPPAENQPAGQPRNQPQTRTADSGQRLAVSNVRTYVDEPREVSTASPYAAENEPAEEPTMPVDEWVGRDFFRWIRWKHACAKLRVPDFPPAEELEDWWRDARRRASVRELSLAYVAFTRDPFWQQATPKLPWAGFAAQWERYLPLERSEDAS